MDATLILESNPVINPVVLPLKSVGSRELPLVGGKGANLGELTTQGYPIPAGFCVTTAAFRLFMRRGDAQEQIYQLLEALSATDIGAARETGKYVRNRLRALTMPGSVSAAIQRAWSETGSSLYYAVRSSATAEDLPEASFAGQQDTFLNIHGVEALLRAVHQCWVSLFTDRAILYRIRNGFSHRDVQLSVVVQQMVEPDVSGILFTADPTTGRRHVAAIDASYGLGEALVSGMVSADQILVDKRLAQVIDKKIGDKLLAIRPSPDGGTFQEANPDELQHSCALSDQQAIELATIGDQIEAHFGRPQDIEWAIADGAIHILQSRPITSLFPVPEEAKAMARKHGQLQVMFSVGAVQGMLGPMTPLGQDAIKGLFAGAATLFGEVGYLPDDQPVIWSAAERLFVNLTALVRHPIGRRVGTAAMRYIEPSVGQAMDQLWNDPRLQPERGWFRPKSFARLLRFFGPFPLRLVRNMLNPDSARERFQHLNADLLKLIANKAEQRSSLAGRVTLLEEILQVGFPSILPTFVPIMGAGMASMNFLNRLARTVPGGRNLVLTIARGMPHNVTSEMDLALWACASKIQADPAAFDCFRALDMDGLAALYLNGNLPETGQSAVAEFLARYGMRGVGEIDFGRKRWREQPAQIMQVLLSYLKIEEAKDAPDRVFARGAKEAKIAIDSLSAAVATERGGQIKAKLVRAAARRMRALSGLRERPKFTIMQLFGMVRALLLDSGQALVDQQVITQPDDLFFLHLRELHELANGKERNWARLIASRRDVHLRESRRRQHPRLLLSDGHAFYDGLTTSESAEAGVLTGSPVSPGVVEGIARVVFDPLETQLVPGEILVCPGTDPAWTPLFLAAAGLVMEVGGLMTHGSVVAREYGIPAVVGVHKATSRLRTGQLIAVDGSAGTITVKDCHGSPPPPTDTISVH